MGRWEKQEAIKSLNLVSNGMRIMTRDILMCHNNNDDATSNDNNRRSTSITNSIMKGNINDTMTTATSESLSLSSSFLSSQEDETTTGVNSIDRLDGEQQQQNQHDASFYVLHDDEDSRTGCSDTINESMPYCGSAPKDDDAD